MSYLSQVLAACPKLQEKLNDNFLTCDSTFIQEQYPFFEFLASEVNNFGLRQKVSPGGGKVRQVELTYEQRIPEVFVEENVANPNCVATTKRGDCTELYEIDTTANVGIDQLVDNADLEDNCEANGTWLARQILKMIDVVDRKSASKSTEEAVLLIGKWGGKVKNVVNDNLEVATFAAGSTDKLAPFTMQNINRATRKTGYCAPVGIFGGDDLSDYFERVQSGCCSQDGNDLASLFARFGHAVAYDDRVATALGGDEFNIVLQPGALAYLWYTKTPWRDGMDQRVIDAADYVQTIVVSPRTGVPMDLTIKDNCGQISFNLVATTKVVGLPSDMFPAGDSRFDQVNFVNKIEVVNV